MRIAVVFSSSSAETAEYQNIWRKCPGARELASDKLVIDGGDWKVFAFDGLSKKYHHGGWNLETVRNETKNVLGTHTALALGVLLHGSKKELNLLMDQLHVPDAQEVFSKWYTSSKGLFFRECIKPFSKACSDVVFEGLWAKLKRTKDRDYDDFDPKKQLIFISHRLGGMIRSMRMVLEDAKEDIVLLQDFRRFDFEFLLKEYQKVDSQVKNLSILEVDEAPKMIKDIMEIIDELSKKDIYSLQDVNLGSICLEKAETLRDLLNQSSEATHD